MDLVALLQGRAQRAVQPVLQVEGAVPLHDVREQVAVERRVLGEQLVEGQLTLGGDQIRQPDRAGRDLGPPLQRGGMVGVRRSVPHRFEDHNGTLPSGPGTLLYGQPSELPTTGHDAPPRRAGGARAAATVTSCRPRVTDRQRPDRGELVRNAECIPECGDAIGRYAEEAATPSPSSTAVSCISSAANPVSMSQYGTGQRLSSRSVQPLSGSAYRSRYDRPVGQRHDDQRCRPHPVQPGAGRRRRRVDRPEESRSAGSLSTRKPQPWEKPAEGARSACSISLSTTSGGTGRSGS